MVLAAVDQHRVFEGLRAAGQVAYAAPGSRAADACAAHGCCDDCPLPLTSPMVPPTTVPTLRAVVLVSVTAVTAVMRPYCTRDCAWAIIGTSETATSAAAPSWIGMGRWSLVEVPNVRSQGESRIAA